METPAAVTEVTPPPRRQPRLPLIVIGLGLVLWLGWKWWWQHTHISSDNAQVESSIVTIMPKVGGFVAEIAVRENQPVQAGDLLLRLDDRDYRARLAQAEADLALALAAAGDAGHRGQASAQVAAARATAAAARSAIDQAQANADKAQKDLERVRELIARKMSSPQALDAAEATARAARAQLDSMRQSAISAGEQVSASSAALSAAQARVEAARAVRDLAANQLADTRLRAPVAGVVAAKSAEVGKLVQPGQPLLSVVPLADIWVTANLKETDLDRIRIGQSVLLDIDAYPGVELRGAVESLSPATGARFALLPPDNGTGNFTKVVQRVPVRIRVDQSADPQHLLRPGLSVVVHIETR